MKPKKGKLRAGVAQIDITPQYPAHLAGSATGDYRPAKFVEDPLYAKALVLENDEKKLCIVSLDLTIVTKEWTEKIRRWAEENCGIDSDAIMVHATQTHSAPSLGYFMVDEAFEVPSEFEWVRGGELKYFEFAFKQIIKAIEQANRSLQPVRWAAGSGIEGRLAFNRRAITREGKAIIPPRDWPSPLGLTFIRYLEGPMDPEVGVVCFQSLSLKFIAMLLHYTCHPVHVFPKLIVSADWPGAWSDEVRKRFGYTCVPLVLNGCCGNINPNPPFDPEWKPDHYQMGRMLAT